MTDHDCSCHLSAPCSHCENCPDCNCDCGDWHDTGSGETCPERTP